METNTCGASVAAGKNCSIAVSFKPTTTGSRTGTLAIIDNASGSPQATSLSGTGVLPVKLSATSVTFASTKVGKTSSSKSVTVTNNQPVAVSLSLGLDGTDPGDFAIASSTTCAATLAANRNCVYTLTFAPAAKGTRSAILTIADSPDPNDPYLITLSGTGR